MKVVCGLGNPGPEYDATRHNVGWWLLDRMAVDWNIGPFARGGSALVADGAVAGHPVRLLKPTTYMNRSGAALAPLGAEEDFAPERDLLVVVDDVALPPGTLRFRASGSSGGHNGLKSIEATLGGRDWARLRIGVGPAPPGHDLAEWVLSPMPPEDEDAVLDTFPRALDGVRAWLDEGIEAAMSRSNG